MQDPWTQTTICGLTEGGESVGLGGGGKKEKVGTTVKRKQ